MICDLHCHTKLSDGSLGIEDVISQAKRMNIDFLSITDHDTMSSFSRADILGERHGVKILHGVELSKKNKKRNSKVHILCYPDVSFNSASDCVYKDEGKAQENENCS